MHEIGVLFNLEKFLFNGKLSNMEMSLNCVKTKTNFDNKTKISINKTLKVMYRGSVEITGKAQFALK